MRLPRGDRYSRGAIAFHWVIAALVLFNLWLGLFHDDLPREWKVMPVHKSVGVTILVLSIGRLAWRLMHKPPHLPDLMPAWEKAAAKAVHWIFYALLFILPLTGWVYSSDPEKIRVVSWFWMIDWSSKALTDEACHLRPPRGGRSCIRSNCWPISMRVRSGSAMAMPATSVISRCSGGRFGDRLIKDASARRSRTR